MILLLLVSLTCTLTRATRGPCPHESKSLQRWSKKTTWPGHEKPTTGSHVNITSEILLDESPPCLYNIHVTETGRLVFSPDVSIDLHASYILIEGKLEIGSENCPHEGEVNINMDGRRGDLDVGDFAKGINVMAGGTLELHGKKKLSWTKLAKTLPKASHLYSKKTENLDSEEGRWIDALLAVSITPTGYEQFTVQKFGVYRIFSNWVVEREKHMKDLLSHLANTSFGDIVLLATQRRTARFVDIEEVYDVLEKLAFGKITHNSTIRNVASDNVYSAVLQKGTAGSFRESLLTMDVSQPRTEARVFFNDWTNGLKLTALSYRHSENDFNDGATFRVTKTSESYPIIDVIDKEVSTWKEGDKVMITSTDYDWKQVEEGTIIPCPACTGRQKRLDLEPKYMHWGEMIDGVLDERAEVGLLSRDIRIQGVMEKTCPHGNENCDKFNYDTFGAHVRVTSDFENVHVEGVELKNVGQQTDKSRYPIHFHMCLDVRNYTNPPYIRSISIHNSFARCVTLHGTIGVTVSDIVCYKFMGHGMFFEEGGEKWNRIDGNLLVGSIPGALIPSDSTPAAFWITNPLNIITNNVGGGGEGNGFWFLFPDEPIGLSKGLGLMAPMEAHHTAVLEFDNNVIHSFTKRGLLFDNKLQPNGAADGINDYKPRERPLDEKSKDVEVVFSRITAFKNMHSNGWIRGGSIRVTKSSFADSVEGLIFASSNSMVQYITESVFIGDSENIGEPFVKEVAGTEYNLNRSVPLPFTPQMSRTGFLFYDGPVFVENVWFDAFKHNSLYKMGALSFNRNNVFGSSPVSSVKNVLFGFADSPSDGNRVYFGDSGDYGFNDLEGDIVSTFRNYDGTMWGLPFTQTVKPIPFHLTPGCFIRPNAKMAFCTEKYGKIRFNVIKGDPKAKVVGVRDDLPSATVTQDAMNSCEFLTALGGRYSYTFHFMDMIPEEFEIFGDGVEKNECVRFGICVSRNAKFDLYTWTPFWKPGLEHWLSVDSIDELENETKTGEKYYYNSSTGMLYMKFISLAKRPDYHYSNCYGYCPRVKITILSGNRSDSDCRPRIYGKEVDKVQRDIPQSLSVIPASAPSAPKGWGAGETRPFHSKQVINGVYGDWSDWSSCSVTCGKGTQIRTRSCDSPSSKNKIYVCDGQSEEQRPCRNDDCVIDGGFTEWSRWTHCYSTSDCQGLQSRKRFCINPVPQGGGLYCQGAVEEVKPCSVCNPYSRDRSTNKRPLYSISILNRLHDGKLNPKTKTTELDIKADTMHIRKLPSLDVKDITNYDTLIDNASGY